MIAKHPEVQDKCFAEITEIIGSDPEKTVTYAELNNLNYLEKVIKETLRIYPSVPLFARYINEETEISELENATNYCTISY